MHRSRPRLLGITKPPSVISPRIVFCDRIGSKRPPVGYRPGIPCFGRRRIASPVDHGSDSLTDQRLFAGRRTVCNDALQSEANAKDTRMVVDQAGRQERGRLPTFHYSAVGFGRASEREGCTRVVHHTRMRALRKLVNLRVTEAVVGKPKVATPSGRGRLLDNRYRRWFGR